MEDVVFITSPVIDFSMGSHTSHYPVIDPVIDPRQIMRQTNDWIARVGLAVMGASSSLL